MRTVNTKTGFTLIEVLMASFLFILTVGCVFVTLNGVRVEVTDKENQLAATVFGKSVLETLYSQVSYSTFDTNVCSATSADGACLDFSLYISAASPFGLHEVTTAKLNAAGLSWPALLAPPCNPSLVYLVSCADGSAGPSCTNKFVARRVDLSIKWPSTATGTC